MKKVKYNEASVSRARNLIRMYREWLAGPRNDMHNRLRSLSADYFIHLRTAKRYVKMREGIQ
jgi:hypothetical protein